MQYVFSIVCEQCLMWGSNKHPLAKLFRLPDVLRFFLHIVYCNDVFSIVRLSEQNLIWGSNKHPHVKLSGLPEFQWFFLHIRQCHMFSPLPHHPSQRLTWGSEKHPSQMCSIASIEKWLPRSEGRKEIQKQISNHLYATREWGKRNRSSFSGLTSP